MDEQTKASVRSLIAGDGKQGKGTDRNMGAFCGICSHLGLSVIGSDALVRIMFDGKVK